MTASPISNASSSSQIRGRTPQHRLDERDDGLLDVAERLFLAKGYGNVSIDLIVRTAGVAARTIYVHFGGKRGLLNRVIERGRARDNEHIAMLAKGKNDLERTLLGLAQYLLGHALSPWTRLLYADAIAERDFELGRKLHGIRCGAWRDLLDDVLSSDAWRRDSTLMCPPAVVCDFFLGCVMGEQFELLHAHPGRVLSGPEIRAMACRATDKFLAAARTRSGNAAR
jgi:TetR/AcrR family transcriptional regulator, mexJK operon transcriptional repressor